MDEPGLEYKTYGLVEVRYVRYALTSLFRVVRGICWAVLAIVPLAVGFFLAQLFHNWDILMWSYIPILALLLWPLMGFMEKFQKAIEELNSVESHVASVNEAYWRKHRQP